ncbi:NADPH oxidase 4-like isoform X2 [Aricia agestis]|uniref:NADPH oxidase 4-like isoform X2 n=1 Tax=Aricia agestis TaxID=91739 RepID=UPI001C2092CA|nr:NADPH oxidase 4-like isoform X2 [Aricia agestis]
MARYSDCWAFITNRIYLTTWISLVIYIFYNSYIYYLSGRQFYYLREILGIGLCVSRGTAAVLNVCCALVLVPMCKKLNLVLYRILSKLCPGMFFLWLEKMKSFHMTVAITLVIFAVIHSISHFVNLWNFSRNYDEVRQEINMAKYKNESPFLLLMSVPGITGVSMLAIVLSMGVTSSRYLRRRLYNVFWYTHQLYLPFLLLLMIHPLSGVLKEEVLDKESKDSTILYEASKSPKFVAIHSMVSHMSGRTISVNMSCPAQFSCRIGQYVLVQCTDISAIEWHPFTVVRLPTRDKKKFTLWIKVKGDWTEALEKCLLEKCGNELSVLIDGPYCSPMEGVCASETAICVAAGVGITPYVGVLEQILRFPRNRLPGRIHLIWIVRHESEITWLADLAERTIAQTRNANRPDRLHLEFYVTGNTAQVTVDEKGNNHIVSDERKILLTPSRGRKVDEEGGVVKKYPLVGCRLKRGRPHWDRVFGYWVHLYPGHHLNLYCCGPKKLVRLLRSKSKYMSRTTTTKFTFVHEAFS